MVPITVEKTLGEETRLRIKTIQTTVQLKSAKILKTVLQIMKICDHSDFNENPPVKADVKNSKGVK